MYLGLGKLAVVIRVKQENPVKTHDETKLSLTQHNYIIMYRVLFADRS